MMDKPIWDRDLRPEEVKHLSPADRGRRAITSFSRKIELLEKYGRDGAPSDTTGLHVRRRTQLRRWSDPEMGLWAWADPAVDDPKGRNQGLCRRFKEAIKLLEQQVARSKSGRMRAINAQNAIIESLVHQNAELVDENNRLKILAAQLPLTLRRYSDT
jgi:hypothetical protein